MVILNVSHSFNLQTLNAKLITTVVATHTHISSAHISTVTRSLPEKQRMFRTWKTETLVSLHSSAIYQPIPKYIYLKTANIHEKIEYENLLLQNNGLGPLLFLASSTSSICIHEWHQMSLLPTWSEYMKTVPVLVTKHVTLCILISHKMEVSQGTEKWRHRRWDHHAGFHVGHQSASDVMPYPQSNETPPVQSLTHHISKVHTCSFKCVGYSVLQYRYILDKEMQCNSI